MLYSISGKLVRKSPFRAVVEVNGVGFDIYVPVSTYEVLPEEGEEVKLFVYPLVQDNNIILYGFWREEERELFIQLIKLTGVGPALAMRVLSGMSAKEFIEAVREGNVEVISRVKGVGRKRAERIIFEMSGKTTLVIPAAKKDEKEEKIEKAVQALVTLGLRETEARNLIEKAIDELSEEATVEEIIRRALGGKR